MWLWKNKSKQDKGIGLQDVDTVASNTLDGRDINRNRIPDYLERPILNSIVNSNKDFSQMEIDTTPEIEEWVMQLRGYEKSENGISYHPVSPPIINEIGINALKSFIISVVNKHSINNNLKEDEVHDIVYYNAIKFNRWLKHNYTRIGLRLSYLTSISIQFENFIYITLLRSVGDKQREHTTNRLKLTGDLNKPANFPA